MNKLTNFEIELLMSLVRQEMIEDEPRPIWHEILIKLENIKE